MPEAGIRERIEEVAALLPVLKGLHNGMLRGAQEPVAGLDTHVLNCPPRRIIGGWGELISG